jgi:hypothetical protein
MILSNKIQKQHMVKCSMHFVGKGPKVHGRYDTYSERINWIIVAICQGYENILSSLRSLKVLEYLIEKVKLTKVIIHIALKQILSQI